MCVTIQLSLYHVHPGTDLMVNRLDMLQQVQLTLGHRRWTRLRRVRLSVRVVAAVLCVVLSFNAGRVCGGISWILVEVFRLYLLPKNKTKKNQKSCFIVHRRPLQNNDQLINSYIYLGKEDF